MNVRTLMGLTLVLGSYEPRGYVAVEHDEMWLGGPHPDQLREDDAKALEIMGATWDELTESWHVFV